MAASEVVRLANTRVGEGFVAVSPEARKKFWLDRARTAAIAKHTNAFKINEDVVIPLNRMGEYTDGIERINIELSIKNKLQLVEQLHAFFAQRQSASGQERRRHRRGRRRRKKCWATACSRPTSCWPRSQARWGWLLANLDQPLAGSAASSWPASAWTSWLRPSMRA